MNIVMIGSGNVATHFASIFKKHHHHIIQVYSKTKANADALAFALECDSITDLVAINRKADLYVIAVADDHIASIAAALPENLEGIVVHCSGATDANVLNRFKHYGVIYPPQSISKIKAVDFTKIPLCIEGNQTEVEEKLLHFAQLFSPNSIRANSTQRLAIHLASVLSNNFSNILFQISAELLARYKLPFDLIKPIILETALKVQDHLPITVQTGPAIRNDQNTIHKHLNFISDNPDLQQIYQLLTAEIVKRNADLKKD